MPMTSQTRKTTSVALVLGGLVVLSYAIRRQQNGRRSALPSRVITIGRSPDELQRLWRDRELRAAVFGSWRDWMDRVSADIREARPRDWGSEMTLTVNPEGLRGAVAVALPTITDRALQKVLQRFQALVETGEMPTLATNPAGRDRMISAA